MIQKTFIEHNVIGIGRLINKVSGTSIHRWILAQMFKGHVFRPGEQLCRHLVTRLNKHTTSSHKNETSIIYWENGRRYRSGERRCSHPTEMKDPTISSIPELLECAQEMLSTNKWRRADASSALHQSPHRTHWNSLLLIIEFQII